jgi:uncharacterized protein YjbI with pentapeptide repeats
MLKDNALKICLSIIILIAISNTGFGSTFELSPQTRMVSAEAIRDQMRNGSAVVYDNVVIYGELDFKDPGDEIGFEKNGLRDQSTDVITSPICITRSKFNGNIVFNNKIFKSIINLDNNIFLGEVHFNGSQFMNDTSFNGSIFKNSAFFLRSHFFNSISLRRILFEGYCGFDRSIFNEKASLKDISFFGDTSFQNTVFKNAVTFDDLSCKSGIFSFYNASFMKGAIFRRLRLEGMHTLFNKAMFSDSADFSESTLNNTDFSKSIFNGKTQVLNGIFHGNTDFRQATFKKDTAFFNSTFNGDVKFLLSKFGQEASFKSTIFNGSATFDNVEFGPRAQFSKAKFRKSAGFNESKFNGYALFDGTTFEGTLFLKMAEYNKMFIRWKSISHLEFDDSSFLLLIENFKKLGFWSDADECYYNYRLERNRYLSFIYRPADLMLAILYGYGKKPERPLIWFAITIFIFGLIFYIMGVVHKIGKKISIFDAIFFSAVNIASGTKTLGSYISQPSEFEAVGRFQYLVVLEKFLGMLLFTMFLSALAGTVIR